MLQIVVSDWNILMILCYIFSCNRRSCCILFALDRGIVELLPYNKQALRELLSVGCIITNHKSLLTLSNNKIGDIHYELLQDESLLSCTFARFMGKHVR